MSTFTHLHVHTQYSLLDGMSKIPDLVDKCLRVGMNALAITDHGNMYGIKEFFDYVDKKNGAVKGAIGDLEKELETLTEEDAIAECKARIETEKQKIFKPIFGCEAYVARVTQTNPTGSRFVQEHKENQYGYHLILLAKNEVGYHNLCKIVSAGFIDGFYGRPRIDHELLEKYHEGLIVASACLAGEVAKAITNGSYAKAKEIVMWYKSIFGDDYYLEVQRHKTDKPGGDRTVYEQQQIANEGILKLAAETNTKIIATNDVHFVEEEHAEAHDRLICMSTGVTFNDPNRLHYTKQEWLKTPEEMAEIFPDLPEALANTQEIVDKVEHYKLKHGPIMPMFDIPTEFGTEEEYRKKYTEDDLLAEFESDEEGKGRIKKLGGFDRVYRIKLEADYLRKLTMDGAVKRYGDPVPEDVMERINFELSVMRNMGFPGYFLIVQDFIAAARSMGISVGPGRGSAAGSVVAYCLKITDVDPLKYDLLFERFLNPDRISLPDIDVDFDDEGRYKILDWITQKYGKERVAHIITFGTMATKSSIKDVARVQELPLNESNYLAKLIPDKLPEDPKTHKAPKVNLKTCLSLVPELKQAVESGSQNVKDILKYATELEGTVRQTGIHACGVIIGADDLTNFAPLSIVKDRTTNESIQVTEYEGSVIEDVGLIKMDFLGLRTLSILKEALSNIKKSKCVDVDIDNIPLDDPETYDLFCHGDTVATFQFESAGMQKYLKELKPSKFEDIIAMNALYRPGPMDYIPDFIERKQGRKKIEYDIPCMEKYLKDTYGITVYQEQVMLLSRLLANFTRGESDTLRKAMGKKQKDKLDHLKPKFIEQGKANGHDADVLEKIWADWEKFASYAFNKSHATCYSWVAYQTAYLKAHYRAEFMAANLTNNISDIATISVFIDDCLHSGIKVLGPDINESDETFTVNKDGDIRFGLAALKGVGNSAASSIIAERNENGPYKDIFDFIKRVNLRNCNKKCIETLAQAGAFDSFPEMHRAQFFIKDKNDRNFVDTLITYAANSNNVNQDQMNIFDMMDASEQALANPTIPDCTPWNSFQQTQKEKEVAGFYISGHPLDDFKELIENYTNYTLDNMGDLNRLENLSKQGKTIKIAGIITEVKKGITQNGREYGSIVLEDYSGSWKWSLYGEEDFKKNEWIFNEGKRIFAQIRVSVRTYIDKKTQEEKKYVDLKPQKLFFLEDCYRKLCKGVNLVVKIQDITVPLAEELKALLDESKKMTRQQLKAYMKKVEKIEITDDTVIDEDYDVPFYLRIVEEGGVFYADFNNFATKVQPERFLKILKSKDLSIPYKVELI